MMLRNGLRKGNGVADNITSGPFYSMVSQYAFRIRGVSLKYKKGYLSALLPYWEN